MKKIYLFYLLSIFYSLNAFSQESDIRITYDATLGASQLSDAKKVYMYSGAVTSGSSGQWEYIVGSTDQDDDIGLMTPLGNNIWTICISPREYYSSGITGTIPEGTQIVAIDLFFRDSYGDKLGHDNEGKSIVIDMTTPTPTSDFPGVSIESCKVKQRKIPTRQSTISNFPNPLVENTIITYYLDENANKVNINVYDMLGQQVKQFSSEQTRAGIHKFNWKGDDSKGAILKNGIYFYSLEINGSVIKTNKMLISR